MKNSATLYGIETYFEESNNLETLSNVTSATNVASVSGSIYDVDPFLEFEGDNETGAGNFLNNTETVRDTYKVQFEAKTIADYDTFQSNFKTVAQKRYTYLFVDSYATTIHAADKCVPVAVTGFEVKKVGKYRSLTVDLKTRLTG